MTTLRMVVFLLWAPLVLFLSSGRLDWIMGWTYSGLYAGSWTILLVAIHRQSPDLVNERFAYHKDAKTWDKVLMPAVAFYAPASIWIVAGLGERFGWPPAFSVGTQIAGVVIFLVGKAVCLWAMTSNKYFSSVVRIQHDRGHVVASSGPYRFVRHPGYVGIILYTMASPFILNSLWAIVPAVIAAGITVLRTSLEDRALKDELGGYEAYADRVQYRLWPGLW